MSGTAPFCRPLAAGELDALAELWWRSWRSTGLGAAASASLDAMRLRAERELWDGWDVTIAARDEGLAGFVALKLEVAVLDQLFVAPEVKGQGIGRALLAVAQWKMPRGFTLRTAADNIAACRFYDKAGLVGVACGTHATLGHALIEYRWSP